MELISPPRIRLKFTYCEPSPHTPLARVDVRSMTEWDYEATAQALRSRSGRFRCFMTSPPSVAAWSSIWRRLGPAHAVAWARVQRRSHDMSLSEVCDAAAALAGEGVVDGTGDYPWERVRTSIRQSAITAAAALETPPAAPEAEWAQSDGCGGAPARRARALPVLA